MKLRTNFVFPFLICGIIAAAPAPDAARILETSPLRFEPAADSSSGQFVARGPKFLFSFSGNQATLRAEDKNVRLAFQGAVPQARIEALQKLTSTTNLFIGNDQSKWRSDVPNYGRLQVRGLYAGVDLVYYGNAGQLEYDLTVKPGADPQQIRLRLEGAAARLDSNGDLIAELIQKRPIAYQVASNGAKIPVDSRYRKNSDGSYGFVLGNYDRNRELVIDPVLSFSYYLTGSYQTTAQGIGIDKIGYLWIAGSTFATDLPIGGNPIQSTNAGSSDIFVAKIDPNQPADRQLVFATFLGGSSNDILGGMAVGPNGDVYLTGNTISSDFPLVDQAQSTLDGTSDAFVAWINSSRKLGYSSYLGGAQTETGFAITYNNKGEFFVTGGTESTDFPTAGSAFQTSSAGRQEAFVAEYNPLLTGTATLVYSTYLGGSGWDVGSAIALAPDGTLWVAGGTYSHDFPMKGTSYQPKYQDQGDAFLAHINISAGTSGLEYTTYLGGSELDQAKNIVVDSKGRAIVTGYTLASNFPVTADAMQPKYAGNTDAFITILDPNASTRAGQLVYSTFFGGSQEDVPFDLKQDSAGNLYICGFTFSPGLATTANAAQPAYDGSQDAFAMKFTPPTAGTPGISYLTYLGSDGLQVAYGIDFDAKDHIYMTGYTSGPIFKALHGIAKTSSAGTVDGFLIGLDIQ